MNWIKLNHGTHNSRGRYLCATYNEKGDTIHWTCNEGRLSAVLIYVIRTTHSHDAEIPCLQRLDDLVDRLCAINHRHARQVYWRSSPGLLAINLPFELLRSKIDISKQRPTTLTSGLYRANSQVADDDLSKLRERARLPLERVLQGAHEDVAYGRRHEEAVHSHFDRLRVYLRRRERARDDRRIPRQRAGGLAREV